MTPFMLLAANPDAQVIKESFLDRLSDGGRILLTGMLTVFAVLCIIWFCLYLMRLFFYDLPKKRAAASTDVPEAVAEENIAPAPAAADDAALIAVIAAAVAAYTGESEESFRVVAFRRIQK